MTDINDLPDGLVLAFGDKNLRLILRDEDTGKIVYDHITHGGVFCSVEAFKVLKETGEIDGTQQQLMWGHPAVWMHAKLMLDSMVTRVLKQYPQILEMARELFER